MSGVNKAIVLGNVGKDPEVKYMPNGEAVANLTIATSEKWKDKQTGQMQEKTEWHRITAYKKLAEIIQQYVKKGSKIYIEGKLQTRKWQDQSGADRYTTEIIANQMQMLDSREGGQSPAPQQQPNSAPQQTPYQQGAQAAQPHQNQAAQQAPAPVDDFENGDIPF